MLVRSILETEVTRDVPEAARTRYTTSTKKDKASCRPTFECLLVNTDRCCLHRKGDGERLRWAPFLLQRTLRDPGPDNVRLWTPSLEECYSKDQLATAGRRTTKLERSTRSKHSRGLLANPTRACLFNTGTNAQPDQEIWSSGADQPSHCPYGLFSPAQSWSGCQQLCWASREVDLPVEDVCLLTELGITLQQPHAHLKRGLERYLAAPLSGNLCKSIARHEARPCSGSSIDRRTFNNSQPLFGCLNAVKLADCAHSGNCNWLPAAP